MKKIILAMGSFALLSVTTVSSQYYYFASINAGENPGRLNTDPETTAGSLPAGWSTVLAGPTPAGTYSTVQNIPFAFNFNGGPVTQYKVSNHGILTFAIGTAVSPGTTPISLPTATVPDSAVVIWGIAGTGSNDDILAKTFGTAPNRQHWVFFSSYTLGGNWSYWSIVLEETTNTIYIVDQRHQSTSGSLTLGVQINSTTATQVTGSPSVSPNASFPGTNPADNTFYEFLQGVQPAFDMATLEVEVPPFPNMSDGPQVVDGRMRNMGSTAITSFDLNYSVNSGATVTVPITSVNITSGSSYKFAHTTKWTPPSAASYTIEVWASNLNSNPDANTTNDKSSAAVKVSQAIPNIIDDYIFGDATVISGNFDGLDDPKDLDFHPDLERLELWVINQKLEGDGGSTTTYYNAGAGGQTRTNRQDGNAWHFMSMPSGIAFSENGNFANSPAVYDANHNGGAAFTGPSLWSSDPAIYAQPSGGNGSHLDMLHESPHSMGITNDHDNAFWLYDGFSNDICYYDFKRDHGAGNDDHDDGIVYRYPGMNLLRIDEEIPNGLVLDKNTGWLYFCDNGNRRVLRLDTQTGNTNGSPSYGPYETLAAYYKMANFTWEVVDTGLVEPSGIDLVEDRLIVADHATGEIIKYDLSGATPVELGRINTYTPGITGLKIGPEGRIWYTNGAANTVTVLTPAATNISETTQQSYFNLYPNPANQTANITYVSPSKSSYNLVVTDMMGKTLFSQRNIYQQTTKLEISEFPSGMYMVVIEADNLRMAKRLMVTE